MTDDELPPGGPPPHLDGMSGDMQDQANAIFFAAVATTRMPMIVTDPNQPDNPIIFANPAFINMTGYEEAELIGRNCRFLQGPETDREIVTQVREAIAAQREVSVEILNYKKNGSSFWNALFVAPVFDKGNNLRYFFASQLDVSRRHDVEDALHHAQKMEAVGRLTAGIAHDFNNLLTVIQGFTEVLEALIDSPTINVAKSKRSIQAILQATSQGSKLTQQLLSFASKQKLEGRVVNLRDLVARQKPLIEKSVGDGITIKFDEIGELCNTRIDPVQAETAILNIAVNARDAMDGHGVLCIDTGSYTMEEYNPAMSHVPQGTYAYLKITDTGTGMDKETLARITEPFFTTKGEGKGTGLGMSMVHGFVQQSGGYLAVTSEVGKGTSVHMFFEQDHGDVEPAVVRSHKVPVGRQGNKETILIVEDKPAVADLAETILSDFGYTVVLADNADSALKVIDDSDQIDVMFSDVMMPGKINGVELAKIVHERKPHIKVLLTTGYRDISMNMTDRYGVSFPLLQKPYKRVDLLERIRSVIDGPDGIS